MNACTFSHKVCTNCVVVFGWLYCKCHTQIVALRSDPGTACVIPKDQLSWFQISVLTIKCQGSWADRDSSTAEDGSSGEWMTVSLIL